MHILALYWIRTSILMICIYLFDSLLRRPGANAVDKHFRTAPFESNIPVLLGLASVWNVTFLGYPARAILPYCQALSKLAPHIQQVLSSASSPSAMLAHCLIGCVLLQWQQQGRAGGICMNAV